MLSTFLSPSVPCWRLLPRPVRLNLNSESNVCQLNPPVSAAPTPSLSPERVFTLVSEELCPRFVNDDEAASTRSSTHSHGFSRSRSAQTGGQTITTGLGGDDCPLSIGGKCYSCPDNNFGDLTSTSCKCQDVRIELLSSQHEPRSPLALACPLFREANAPWSRLAGRLPPIRRRMLRRLQLKRRRMLPIRLPPKRRRLRLASRPRPALPRSRLGRAPSSVRPWFSWPNCLLGHLATCRRADAPDDVGLCCALTHAVKCLSAAF